MAAANPKKGLGRGLDALLADNVAENDSGARASMVRTLDIEPNRSQPRKRFEPEALRELADSISEHGLIQPIVVRRRDNGYYEIIAGERRWRACKMAGLSEVPVIVKDISDEQAAEISLVENLQREDLNPIEEAAGYRDLIDAFGLTQEEAAKKVGKSRAEVANILRLLRLPQKVQDFCIDGSLSYGHARTLLPLCDVFSEEEVCGYASNVVANELSVRDTERFVRLLLDGGAGKEDNRSLISRAYYRRLESKAGDVLGRKVSIRLRRNGSGTISLAYSSSDDLEALMKSLCGSDFFADDEE